MPRLNVEEEWFTDPRRTRLATLVGGVLQADGVALTAWKLAQHYWFKGRELIPEHAWKGSGLPDALFECGLAERQPDGRIYVRGSEDKFAWYQPKIEQRLNAAPRGGRARMRGAKRDAKGRLLSSRKPADIQPNPAEPSPSSSLSSSPSVSSSVSPSGSKEKLPYSVGSAPSAAPSETEAPEGVRSPIGFFIANYVNAYQVRYGSRARPDLSGKVQGQIRRFVTETPLDRACELIQAYLQMNDGWFLTKAHDFGTFIENLSKVGLALDTGRAVTQTEARNLDRKQSTYNAFAHLIEESEKPK